MIFLTSLSVLLTVLVLFNLFVTVVLVRRVRELDQSVADLNAVRPQPLLPIGVVIDAFSTDTVEGEPLTDADLMPETVVGFFDPQCETCRGHIPDWVANAERLPGGKRQALAVVREHDTAGELVSPLSKGARVVVEPKSGPVARAFGVQATPSFCTIGAGRTIVGHGYGEAEIR
ncbi:hypothetical protein LX16_2851 [Stackebrandtia albiflava]|uniref:Thioredoxin domain-containing protein n=1 Tax=Stackebrandtia albiflava TaxID=406432 RepID=A0A562V2N8_9ACTN|nr:hypothetical protein [Stackebrandtia albiflava]TWJ12103.1 hypothetical protein LX16_2851 [Stackebrandtia albiflava]